MAFQLRSDESVSQGLQRLARKELKSARSAVNGARAPNDEAIHEARKSVKKVRAILQLIEDDDGEGLGRSEKRLRSELRDAAAMVETLAAFTGGEVNGASSIPAATVELVSPLLSHVAAQVIGGNP